MNNPEFVDTYCTVVGFYSENWENICEPDIESSKRLSCVDIKVSYAKSRDSIGYGYLYGQDQHNKHLLQLNVTEHVS
jgi:hypothetical protein